MMFADAAWMPVDSARLSPSAYCSIFGHMCVSTALEQAAYLEVHLIVGALFRPGAWNAHQCVGYDMWPLLCLCNRRVCTGWWYNAWVGALQGNHVYAHISSRTSAYTMPWDLVRWGEYFQCKGYISYFAYVWAILVDDLEQIVEIDQTSGGKDQVEHSNVIRTAAFYCRHLYHLQLEQAGRSETSHIDILLLTSMFDCIYRSYPLVPLAPGPSLEQIARARSRTGQWPVAFVNSPALAQISPLNSDTSVPVARSLQQPGASQTGLMSRILLFFYSTALSFHLYSPFLTTILEPWCRVLILQDTVTTSPSYSHRYESHLHRAWPSRTVNGFKKWNKRLKKLVPLSRFIRTSEASVYSYQQWNAHVGSQKCETRASFLYKNTSGLTCFSGRLVKIINEVIQQYALWECTHSKQNRSVSIRILDHQLPSIWSLSLYETQLNLIMDGIWSLVAHKSLCPSKSFLFVLHRV